LQLLNSIQSIRGLATLLVVLFHVLESMNAWVGYFMGGGPVPQSLCFEGFLDVFFVLSGFIMTYVTKDSETPGGFLFKRFTRLTPLYWIMTTITILAILKAPWIFNRANLSAQAIFSSYFFIPYPDVTGERLQPIVLVGWCLNIELMFFACFALSLMLPKPWRTRGCVLALGAVCLVGNALSGQSHVAAFYGKSYTLDLLLGCLLPGIARLHSMAAFAKRTPMWPFIVGAIAVLVALGQLFAGHEGLIRYAFCIPAALVVLSCGLQDIHRPPTRRNLLVFYGDCSYSLYITHQFVVQVVGTLVFRALAPNPITPWLAAPIVFAAVLSSGSLVYFFVELKCNQLLRKAAPAAAAFASGLIRAARLQPKPLVRRTLSAND
jgi:peptidoglycan/LPS O-acetylase OafA/YrhL